MVANNGGDGGTEQSRNNPQPQDNTIKQGILLCTYKQRIFQSEFNLIRSILWKPTSSDNLLGLLFAQNLNAIKCIGMVNQHFPILF